MIKGTIKFFSKGKGFGFIAPDGGAKDVFLPMAVITASGIANLTAGQRVSFDTEPDAKGPKAVSLTLLDEKPVPVEKPKAPAPRPAITLYHDPASEDSEDVLEALEDEGVQARLVDYMTAPPGPDELKRLSLRLREAGQSAVRRYDSLFLALQLDDRFIGEADFWRGIIEHPALINGPVLVSGDKARVCKSAADVRAFLGKDAAGDETPAAKPKGLSARMLAMLSGGPVPERPAPKTEEPAPAKPAKVEAEKPAPKPAKTKASAKVTAKVEKKVPARKVAAKPAAPKPAAPKPATKKAPAKKKK